MRVVEPLVPVWVAAGDIGAAPPLPISSVACGLAWNLPALVIFRIIQGLGGGAIIPTAQATLFARFPREQAANPNQRYVPNDGK